MLISVPLSVELQKKQKLRKVFVDSSNGLLVIDGGAAWDSWPIVARFGQIWPDLATFVAEFGQFSGHFTATRAMKVNDHQECKDIEF